MYMRKVLLSLRHENGASVCKLYGIRDSKVTSNCSLLVYSFICGYSAVNYPVNTVCSCYLFYLLGTVSQIWFYCLIQLEKARWFLAWISWSWKTGIFVRNTVTGKFQELLSCIHAILHQLFIMFIYTVSFVCIYRQWPSIVLCFPF